MTSLSKNDVQENNTKVSPYRPVSEKWKKVLLVFNPVAGRSEIRTELVDILETLSADSYLVTCYPTKCQGDARHIVRTRQGDYTYVICSGGDGTLDEVVSGMMENRNKPVIPIGYIPAGTTNDFASGIHLSSNIRTAVDDIVNGSPHTFDAGMFNQRYFSYVASFGAFTEASYSTPQNAKNIFGHLAYLMEGMKELSALSEYHVRLQFDDQVIDDQFAFVSVSNARSMGGVIRIKDSDVDLNDGLLEILLIKLPKNPIELSQLMTAVNTQTFKASTIMVFQTSEVHIHLDQDYPWTLDGEKAYGGTDVEIRCIKDAYRLITPD